MEQRQEYQEALNYWLLCINLISMGTTATATAPPPHTHTTTTITNLINVHHHHCQVNITNQLGETPLHLAVENAKGSAGDENPTELVQFLVDR